MLLALLQSRSAACRREPLLPARLMAQRTGTMRLIGVQEMIARILLCDVRRFARAWRRHPRSAVCSGASPLHVTHLRNMSKAAEVVAAASARGALPDLQELLVEPTWREVLAAEFDKPTFKQLQRFLHREWAEQKIFPPQAEIFRYYSPCSTCSAVALS